MSFILDALKKSETDRQRAVNPALFEVKVAQPRRGFPGWAIGLGVLLVVNAIFVGWMLLRGGSAPAPQAATESAPAADRQPAPVAQTPAAATPGSRDTTLSLPPGATLTVNVPPDSSQPGVVAPSTTPPLAEEPMLSGNQQSVPPDYDARDYRPAITPAQANSANEARATAGVQTRDEALANGAQLPELRLDLHVYAANPAERFVFINMRKLREGDSLPDGTRVESITQRGVELSYRGTRFTLEGN